MDTSAILSQRNRNIASTSSGKNVQSGTPTSVSFTSALLLYKTQTRIRKYGGL